MIFEVFVQAVADTFGTSLVGAGLLMGLFFSLIMFLLVEIAAKGKGRELNGLVVGLFCTILFTVMEWYPVWTGTTIGLALAVLIAWYVSKMGGR